MQDERFYLTRSQIKKIDQAKDFWKKQFQTEPTNKQRVFDGIFGVILPVICFFFDPTVFKGGVFSSGAFMADYKPFAYTLSFVSIMALLAFLLWDKKLKWLNGLLSGLFTVGAIISLGIGILLSPLSLLGLIILIGVLGFTPLFTAFVFLRNAFRAYKTAQPFLAKNILVNSFVLSSIFSLVIPFIINVKAQKGLETMKTGDAKTIRATAQRFEYIAPFVNFDSLAGEYEMDKPHSERNIALAESYYQLTGKDLKTIADEKLKMRMAE